MEFICLETDLKVEILENVRNAINGTITKMVVTFGTGYVPDRKT
jgi:hypothetical protein